MYEQAKPTESLGFLSEDYSMEGGPLDQASRDTQAEQRKLLERELSHETAGVISINVGRRGAMLNYQRNRVENQSDYQLAA